MAHIIIALVFRKTFSIYHLGKSYTILTLNFGVNAFTVYEHIVYMYMTHS